MTEATFVIVCHMHGDIIEMRFMLDNLMLIHEKASIIIAWKIDIDKECFKQKIHAVSELIVDTKDVQGKKMR